MKPTTRKHKDIRGRKVRGYSAAFGPIETSDMHQTPADAIATCERSVLGALARLDDGAKILEWRQHLIVIIPTVVGWAYWIDTFSRKYFNGSGAGDFDTCERSALLHIGQALWNHETDDQEYLSSVTRPDVRSELAGWIGFQRCYRQIQTAGEITDKGQIHQAACEMSYAYTREHFNAYIGRSA